MTIKKSFWFKKIIVKNHLLSMTVIVILDVDKMYKGPIHVNRSL